MADAASGTQLSNLKGKVGLNPFTHLAKGIKQFFKVNLVSGLLAVAVATVANLIMFAVLLVTIFVSLFDIFSPDRADIAGFLVKMCVAAVVFALVIGYFNSVVSRIVIMSVRGQKESLGSAMKLVWKRLPQIFLTYLTIIGIVVLALTIIGFVTTNVPPLGIILYLVSLVLAVIWAFRLVYIDLVLIDTEPVTGPKQVFTRSANLWKKSGGAVIMYVLLGLVVYFALTAVSGGFSKTDSSSSYESSDFTTTTTVDGETVETFDQAKFNAELDAALKDESGLDDDNSLATVMGALFVYVFISNLFAAFATAGLASIYTDARKVVHGKAAAHTASGAPKAPSA